MKRRLGRTVTTWNVNLISHEKLFNYLHKISISTSFDESVVGHVLPRETVTSRAFFLDCDGGERRINGKLARVAGVVKYSPRITHSFGLFVLTDESGFDELNGLADVHGGVRLRIRLNGMPPKVSEYLTDTVSLSTDPVTLITEKRDDVVWYYLNKFRNPVDLFFKLCSTPRPHVPKSLP